MRFEQAMVDEFQNSMLALSDNLYPLVAPAGTVAPYVVYASSEGEYDRTLEGYQGSRAIPVTINVVALNYDSLKQNTAAIIALLIGFQGRAIGGEGLHINELVLNEPDEFYDEETKLYKSVFSFTVHI
ncbi:DUF3168 domain-containing protein [Paenibacillus sp. N4]|uniref:DUF3168 domain-containing protein n=1 Tax=Paenibacillus vietnamensis TaxID=2590547 RepID=UPI001CD04A3F|nr:DUF3168 domain-containing protein [Paenibacillus vietnamensis]MCA0754907.1 DUF3168 domain-containing protein [Paenibacillus vietnamensis]